MSESERSLNFIEQRVEADLAAGTYSGRVRTRFPPEPNGYLHIGHAKSICLQFGLAQQYGGDTNLRFDDTNPEKEDTEYVESILHDIRWLGFEPARVLYASDYFEQLYQWAEKLIVDGNAYVDESSVEELRASRGTVTEPGTPTPGRSRSPEENLDLFRRMRAGEFPDGAMVLRAKIDLAHANMKMRDPLMYRIRHAHHFRTGDDWCIYPMYDWAHGQSDAIERITHSLCTLEFENNRELYDWFLDAIGAEAVGTSEFPRQTEFARLYLNYTVMSKRKFLRLVNGEHVDGWDDPRMPTIAGLRRRGYTPEALRDFAERVGMARANSVVDYGLLEHCVRDDLNRRAVRRMAVLDPLPVQIVNVDDEADAEWVDAPDFPPDVGLPGSRKVPFSGRILIERADFAEDPPKGFKRLVPGGEVRLRYSYVLRCEEVVHDDAGNVVGLMASIDPDTKGRHPGRKIGGTIHWVSADHAEPIEVRLYDRLFKSPSPDAAEDFLTELNPDSLTVMQAYGEPALGDLEAGGHVQLERQGYFYRDPSREDFVLNRVVTLKDSWARKQEAPKARAKTDEGPSGAEAAAANEALRAQQVADFLAAHPELGAEFDRLVEAGAKPAEARIVLADDGLRALLAEAEARLPKPRELTAWLCHVVAPAVDGDNALTGASLAELVGMVEDGRISKQVGRQLVPDLVRDGGSAAALVAERGLEQVSDADALGTAIDEVLAALPAEVERFRGGDKKLFGFFIGQVMRATGGKADAKAVQKLLRSKLG